MKKNSFLEFLSCLDEYFNHKDRLIQLHIEDIVTHHGTRSYDVDSLIKSGRLKITQINICSSIADINIVLDDVLIVKFRVEDVLEDGPDSIGYRTDIRDYVIFGGIDYGKI